MGYFPRTRDRGIRIIAGAVAVSGGTPSVVAGSGFTVSDTAAGKVTINITKPGKSLISAVATPRENTDATGYSCKIMGSSRSASAVVVGVYVADGTDGAPVDNVGFEFVIIVKDVAT